MTARATTAGREADPASALRRAVVALTAASIAGIATELVIERHWGPIVRLIPWLALLVAAIALAMLVRRPSARTIRSVRIVAVALLVTSLAGVALHVNENYTAGPLDARYSEHWESMDEPSRWWAAFTKSVGPAPTFAPGALAEVGLLLSIATLRHPALGVPISGTTLDARSDGAGVAGGRL